MPIATFYARKENRDAFDQLIGETVPFTPWSGRALREPRLFLDAAPGARPLIGAAMDYLVRFYAEALNPATFQTRGWVAGAAAHLLPVSETEGADLENLYAFSQREHEAFCRNEQFTDGVLTAAFYLAQMEASVRAVRYHGPPRIADRAELDDLHALCCFLHDQAWIVAGIRVDGNVDLGRSSLAVGGAFADIIVDDMLIDVKTVGDWKAKERETFRQLVTYLALAWVEADQSEPGLHYLGAYLARQGELVGFEAARVTKRRGWRRFVRWLAKLAGAATRARTKRRA